MPANLLSAAFAWLATHLVTLSLLGFLISGLFVFGLVDATGRAVLQPQKTLPPAAQSRPDGAGSVAAKTRESAASAVTPPVDPVRDQRNSEAGRLQPRLIGGSLPNYRQQGLPLTSPGAAPGTVGGGFRPPAEEPGAMAGGMMTREDHVQQARRAFWNGDFEAAEAAYMALLAEYPADADAFGELGNLYQSMGRQERALDAYFEAAVRLKAAGDNEKLKQVMELLTGEGDPRVDQLRP